MCLHHSISTDINSDRTRAVVKVCVDKKPKKLNILVHSKTRNYFKERAGNCCRKFDIRNDVLAVLPTSFAFGKNLSLYYIFLRSKSLRDKRTTMQLSVL